MKNRNLFVLAFFALITTFSGCDFFSTKPDEPPASGLSLADSLKRVREEQFATTLEEAADQIRFVLENRMPGQRYLVEERALFSSVLLPRFYTSRAFKPFWFSHPDSLRKAENMIQFIGQTRYHGLLAEDYHLAKASELFTQMKADSAAIFDAVDLAHLDLLLSDAWFMIASHLYNGKVDPEDLSAQWGIQRNRPELQLDKRLSAFEGDDAYGVMQQFFPPHPGYPAMVKEAVRLSQLKGLPALNFRPQQTAIKPGETDPLLPGIRQRLELWGLYEPDSLANAEYYDEHTAEAVRKIQKIFGYQQDGIIGRLTLNAINMSPEQRLKQLYVNMERLRWLPDSLEARYVLVNIADFSLYVMAGNDTLLQMKTIVGKDYRSTPVFNSRITYLVFSPWWTVPPGIQKADVIPAVARNINYLKEKNMLVFNARGQQVDPATIHWRREGMRYIIRQAPGPQNALGKVKFMFPNKYNVYLHDTPSRELFARDERTFSSGCIRVEKPFELARLLLDDQPEWTDERIRQAMNSGTERTVLLRKQPGVYLYYLTAWATADGQIAYRTDIYDRDEEVFTALQQKKRSSLSSSEPD
ncbi:MAG: L,D-transpeptidase family protein [Bacteroidetes bacterium]|nr:L,D-transpeptidase family protein [Bacteroidota bacterium]